MKMSLAKGRTAHRVSGLRRGIVLGLVLAVSVCVESAHAFYPLGVFGPDGNLVIVKWPLREMDTNGDGDVQQGEGVPLIFESGEWGFTEDEMDTVLTGLQTWQNVPTAYVGFRRTDITPDPLELSADIGSVDFLNYVAFEFNGDGSEDPEVLPDNVGALALVTFALVDSFVTVDGVSYPVTGGEIIETDYVFDGNFYRDAENAELASFYTLQGTATAVGGLSLALNVSPLVNAAELYYESEAETDLIAVREPRVVALPNENGELELVGTSSSMQINFALLYDDDDSDSRIDLAPDDIAGISYLYPRASQANFVNLKHEARSRSRLGAPSARLEGAHIVAYCDVDNDPTTLPVPFSDTLSGLYEFNSVRRNFFDVKGMYKQLQLLDGTLFEPTYIITCAPFDPLDETNLSVYDSTNGGILEAGPNPLNFSTLFSSEVFNEFGNLLGLENMPGGTPLRFDAIRNRFVSAETERSLTQMLPGNSPMFGTEDSTCPYLRVVGETAILMGMPTQGTKFLRDVRDRYLLQSAPGLVLVDAYYHAAPAVSEFLRGHSWAATAVRALVWSFEWSLGHRYALALLALAFPAVLWLGRRRPRAARAAAATLLALVIASPATAQSIGTKELVSLSNDIVAGKVTSAESRFDENNRIVTDVTIAVDDTMKGRLNKGGRVSFEVLGGRVGDIVTYSVALPQFSKGEDVVVFLKAKKNGETTVTGGAKGKVKVETDKATKKKIVVKASPMAPPEPLYRPKPSKAEDAKKAGLTRKSATAPAALQERRVALEDYKQELRRMVREQEKASRRQP